MINPLFSNQHSCNAFCNQVPNLAQIELKIQLNGRETLYLEYFPLEVRNLAGMTLSKFGIRNTAENRKRLQLWYVDEDGDRIGIRVDSDLKILRNRLTNARLFRFKLCAQLIGEKDLGDRRAGRGTKFLRSNSGSNPVKNNDYLDKLELKSVLKSTYKELGDGFSQRFSQIMKDHRKIPCKVCLGCGRSSHGHGGHDGHSRECQNCYGNGYRPRNNKWSLITKIIDFRLKELILEPLNRLFSDPQPQNHNILDQNRNVIEDFEDFEEDQSDYDLSDIGPNLDDDVDEDDFCVSSCNSSHSSSKNGRIDCSVFGTGSEDSELMSFGNNDENHAAGQNSRSRRGKSKEGVAWLFGKTNKNSSFKSGKNTQCGEENSTACNFGSGKKQLPSSRQIQMQQDQQPTRDDLRFGRSANNANKHSGGERDSRSEGLRGGTKRRNKYQKKALNERFQEKWLPSGSLTNRSSQSIVKQDEPRNQFGNNSNSAVSQRRSSEEKSERADIELRRLSRKSKQSRDTSSATSSQEFKDCRRKAFRVSSNASRDSRSSDRQHSRSKGSTKSRGEERRQEYIKKRVKMEDIYVNPDETISNSQKQIQCVNILRSHLPLVIKYKKRMSRISAQKKQLSSIVEDTGLFTRIDESSMQTIQSDSQSSFQRINHTRISLQSKSRISAILPTREQTIQESHLEHLSNSDMWSDQDPTQETTALNHRYFQKLNQTQATGASKAFTEGNLSIRQSLESHKDKTLSTEATSGSCFPRPKLIKIADPSISKGDVPKNIKKKIKRGELKSKQFAKIHFECPELEKEILLENKNPVVNLTIKNTGDFAWPKFTNLRLCDENYELVLNDNIEKETQPGEDIQCKMMFEDVSQASSTMLFQIKWKSEDSRVCYQSKWSQIKFVKI